MALAACLVLVVSLGAAADVSQTFRFAFQQGQPADPEKSTPQGNLRPASTAAEDAHSQSATAQAASAHHTDTLTEESRMAILRALSGEFVRAQSALPGGKDGTHVSANPQPILRAAAPQPQDGPVVNDNPRVMVVAQVPAIQKGDRVQITQVQFRNKSIVFQLNGGGYKPFRLKDHLHIEVMAPVSSSVDQPGGPVAYIEGQGATLYLDFDRPIPDVTPADIKHALAPFLDFALARSPALQYAQSLPPEFQQAIKERMAVVGMDRDMVLAAMGRPGRKVRERDENGNETEDWIYGTPPDKTVFVTFLGDKVVRVHEFH